MKNQLSADEPFQLSKPSNLKSSRALLDIALTDESFKDVKELILSKMTRDETHIIIRNDASLLLYGAIQLRKTEKQRYNDIRYSLRILARALREFRKNPGMENACGKDLVQSNNYELVVEAVKTLSGYKGPRKIKTPSIFLKTGFCLKNLAEYVRCIALKECDQSMVEKIRNFVELYESDWLIYAVNARATYEEKKAFKPELLPLETDVKIFRTYVLQEINRVTKICTAGKNSLQDLRDLSKLVLARIMTFNARRGGEVSKLKLKHWEGVEDGRWKRKSDVDLIDDVVERTLANRLQICYV